MDAVDDNIDPWETPGRQLPTVLCRGGVSTPLPAQMVTRQTFAWQCPFAGCEKYHPFVTHDILSGLTAANLKNCDNLINPLYFFVNRGVVHVENYVGVPYPVLGKVNFTDSTIPADGISTSLAFVDACWIPSPEIYGGLFPRIVWSFVGDVPTGATHESTANPFIEIITAGTEVGKATISAVNTICNSSDGTIHFTKPKKTK